jgi:hypothetical protein
MRYKLLMTIVSVFLFTGGAIAQFGIPAKEAKKDGWWIKVSTKDPESQRIGFYVGATENSTFLRIFETAPHSSFWHRQPAAKNVLSV